jgi:hypothetical protein
MFCRHLHDMYVHSLYRHHADHSGCAVKGMNCLLSLERWDRGFESHSRHEYLYCVRLICVCVVQCVGTGLAMG